MKQTDRLANLSQVPPTHHKIVLQAETVDVSKRSVQGATVRVETVTREREHNVDETIFKEEVEVERVSIGREVSSPPEVVQTDELTIIPVMEEVVIVTRKLFLKEEIHIKRVRTPVQHQETIVLRNQEAIVTRHEPTDLANPDHQPFQQGETL